MLARPRCAPLSTARGPVRSFPDIDVPQSDDPHVLRSQVLQLKAKMKEFANKAEAACYEVPGETHALLLFRSFSLRPFALRCPDSCPTWDRSKLHTSKNKACHQGSRAAQAHWSLARRRCAPLLSAGFELVQRWWKTLACVFCGSARVPGTPGRARHYRKPAPTLAGPRHGG